MQGKLDVAAGATAPSRPGSGPAAPDWHQLPLRIGTRGSPLALVQTRTFLALLARFCPVLRGMDAFQERKISTTGDRVTDRRLADIGGKGLFAKEIHEALLDGRIDFAVHSLKDLETTLPPGIALACMLPREDARDALILSDACDPPRHDAPFACLPQGAVIGTSSLRRQAQLLHARPDLRITLLRGNVQSRLAMVAAEQCTASLLAHAGLRRLGLADEAALVLEPEAMLPAAGQGIVGVTVRADDVELLELLSAIEDRPARAAATAERAMLAALEGSCHTPIGAHAVLLDDGGINLTGLVARADGSFLLRRSLRGAVADAARLGAELGTGLRADSPRDVLR